MDNRLQDSETFHSILWEEYISPFMVSDAYLAKHDDFIRELTFDLWVMYSKDSNLTITRIARILEAFFKNTFSYKPSTTDHGEKFFE